MKAIERVFAFKNITLRKESRLVPSIDSTRIFMESSETDIVISHQRLRRLALPEIG
jgi:hypothetical protein